MSENLHKSYTRFLFTLSIHYYFKKFTLQMEMKNT